MDDTYELWRASQINIAKFHSAKHEMIAQGLSYSDAKRHCDHEQRASNKKINGPSMVYYMRDKDEPSYYIQIRKDDKPLSTNAGREYYSKEAAEVALEKISGAVGKFGHTAHLIQGERPQALSMDTSPHILDLSHMIERFIADPRLVPVEYHEIIINVISAMSGTTLDDVD